MPGRPGVPLDPGDGTVRCPADGAPTAERSADDGAAPPYRGLRPFEAGDRGLFFGRDELVARLAARVRSHRLVAVVGASGSGKSSLLRAGLIPALRDGGGTPGGRPAAVRVVTPGAHRLPTLAVLMAPSRKGGDTVVLVDRFEELFTLWTAPDERAAFLDLVLAAVEPGSRLRVVVAVRADFFLRCTEHRRLAAALRGATVRVGPMGPAQLREAITGPAAAAGLVVERPLTARILREAAGVPGALPLLSHALLETWRRRAGGVLTEEMYDAAGGLGGAVAATAEGVYAGLTPAQAEASRRLMLRLAAPAGTARETRRPAHRGDLEPGSPEVGPGLVRFVRAGILTLDGDTVELAHESLVTAWPRLRAWVEDDRERLRLHRRLGEAARVWEQLGRDPAALYRGVRLTAAEDAFAVRRRTALSGLEHAFLHASIAARDHEPRAASGPARRLRALTGRRWRARA